MVAAGKLDGTGMQHFRAQARQFQHFLEGDQVEAPCIGDYARVGRVDAVDIGADLALIRLQGSGDGHCRCI